MAEQLKIHITPGYLMCPTHGYMMPATKEEMWQPYFWTECITPEQQKALGLGPCDFQTRRRFKMPEMVLEEAPPEGG